MATPTKCDFCSRPKNEVKSFVRSADETKFICNFCIIDAAQASMSADTKSTTTSKKKEVLRKPKEIKAFLDDYVIAQDRAKVDVAVAVYNHYKRREVTKRLRPEDQGRLGDIEIQKSNILLLGPSGTGKTELARTIARMLNVPFYVGDATKLTQAGYVGDDVESLLQGLLQQADGDTDRAEWGIIFIDEIDKVARKNGRGMAGYRDVSGEGVQQALLKLLEGSKVSVPRGMGTKVSAMSDVLDTTNILFICAGSFAGIEEIVEARMAHATGGKRVGFGSSNEPRKKLSKSDVYSAVTEDDILEFGLIPEMMGRLPVLTTTLELTEEEMVRVLTEPKNSITKQFQALFSMDGVSLTFSPEGLHSLAVEAKRRPTGARALRSIVEKTLSKMMFEVPGSDIESIVLTDRSVSDGDLVISRRANPKEA